MFNYEIPLISRTMNICWKPFNSIRNLWVASFLFLMIITIFYVRNVSFTWKIVNNEQKLPDWKTHNIWFQKHLTSFRSIAPIYMDENEIGYVVRLYPTEGEIKPRPLQSACWLMPHDRWMASDNNSPMPLKTRSWMDPTLLKGSNGTNEYILYYSSHSKGNNTNDISILGTPGKHGSGPWNPIATKNKYSEASVLSLEVNELCESFHSPSIVVNDQTRSLFMYVHGHHCKGTKKGMQPTILFHSFDGLHWSLWKTPSTMEIQSSPFLIVDVFYLSPPTVQHQDGYYYAVAKTQESDVGSAILCRAPSTTGPFVKGPILATGLRHSHLELVQDRYLVLFTSRIGDAPEHIFLGIIDTNTSENWEDWKLLLGPKILEPRYQDETGLDVDIPENVPFPNWARFPSISGAAEKSRVELRDPRFIPDALNVHRNAGILSGLLFYTVQGEQSFAVSYLFLNITDYLKVVLTLENNQET
jgi:hypothetical protein